MPLPCTSKAVSWDLHTWLSLHSKVCEITSVNCSLGPHSPKFYLISQKMRFSLQQLLLVALGSSLCTARLHLDIPQEADVESPSLCKTSSDGFGGRPLDQESYEENIYFYELTFTGTDIDAAISDLEVRIADYLLSETSLFDICVRRLNSVKSPSSRKLQQGGAVAITTRPDDFPYDDSKFLASTFAFIIGLVFGLNSRTVF